MESLPFVVLRKIFSEIDNLNEVIMFFGLQDLESSLRGLVSRKRCAFIRLISWDYTIDRFSLTRR